ncbi:MAG: YcnI family protein [Alphaproteobacteria bacterium]|nr:YcnI family protein [Alphaproteobacteria bacterium]
MSVIRIGGAPALALLIACAPAVVHAHVTLESREAPAGSYHKVVLRVPHGCKGSPTLKVRVRVPDGVTGVKAQPKPGWELATVKGKLAKPVDDGHGGQITEGVNEVTWSGRLLDEHYDEFVMRVKLPDAPDAVLHWPVVQECEVGVHRWIEIPAPGKSADDYPEPAPALRLKARN